MNKFKIALCLSGLLIGYSKTWSQQPALRPQLNDGSLHPVNRTISMVDDAQRGTTVRVHAKPNAGVAWVSGVQFEKGMIEFDVKGKDIFQQSFVGIAFHGVDDSTYQAIYFRPFNFHASDPERKKHAVQYLSLPDYDWPYLRETFPDSYEAPMPGNVDPNAWFHVKIEVDGKTITVFVDTEPEPALVVQSLRPVAPGKVGFWTGHNSDGDFANLTVKPSVD